MEKSSFINVYFLLVVFLVHQSLPAEQKDFVGGQKIPEKSILLAKGTIKELKGLGIVPSLGDFSGDIDKVSFGDWQELEGEILDLGDLARSHKILLAGHNLAQEGKYEMAIAQLKKINGTENCESKVVVKGPFLESLCEFLKLGGHGTNRFLEAGELELDKTLTEMRKKYQVIVGKIAAVRVPQ